MDQKLSLKQIQKSELEILKVFSEVCDKNGLRYFLAGGTLLGAIRHKGFIPWDDDIDILMPRPDYDKFQDHFDEIEEYTYYKVSSHEKKTLNYPFTKVFDVRTNIKKKYVTDSTEKNIWIDILPLDGLPDNETKIRILFYKSLLARRLLKIKKSKWFIGTSNYKAAVKMIVKLILFPVPIKCLVNYIDQISRAYDFNSHKYVAGVAMGYGPQEKMDKKNFLEFVYVNFEGYQFKAPGCWDHYLSSLYGDYMKLPPIELQKAHPMDVYVNKDNL